MVRAVPDVPGAARRTCSTTCSTARAATCRTRGSCSTGRPRCSTTTSRCGPRPRPRCAALAARRPAAGRAVDDPHGRVHGLGRDHRARPAARHRARATELGGAMPRRLPPRHVRPRRADAADPAPRRARARGGVARRARRRSTRPRSGGRRPTARAVRAEYLYGSYSNGRDLPDDAKQLVARARGYEVELGAGALPGGGMLLMNGTDHQLPQPWLGRVVAEANDDAGRLPVRGHVAPRVPARRSRPTASPTWRGELRSGARANVLMGVASNRVDVHQACAAAERALERARRAAVARCCSPPDRLSRTRCSTSAWRHLVLNSAHDSSCACSADEVVDAVRVRYQEARQIGDGARPRGAAHARDRRRRRRRRRPSS